MANTKAIRAVGSSIVKFLDSSYPDELREDFPATFRVLSSGDLAEDATDPELGLLLSFYLYRITVNDHLRNVRPVRTPEAAPPLSLNLHYLMSVWSRTADPEHVLMGWAMQHLHQHPIMDSSLLMPDGGWQPHEVIHITPDELTNEDLLRLWESFTPTYRLSYSYVARVVVLEPAEVTETRRVVALRQEYVDQAGAREGRG